MGKLNEPSVNYNELRMKAWIQTFKVGNNFKIIGKNELSLYKFNV